MPSIPNKPLVAILLQEMLPSCVIEGLDYSDRTELDAEEPAPELDPGLISLIQDRQELLQKYQITNTSTEH